MSRPLQADEAIDLLIKDPSKYQSPQALRELARQVSVESPGQVTVLYSGRITDRVSAWNIVKAMEEAGEDVRLIDRTEINSFLNSREFTRAVAVAHGVTVDDMRRGDPIAKAANDWLYHPTEGPWADASARFADATRGEVKVIASGAAPDRVFGQTELPRILANPDVTTVEGIPRQTLAARQATHGTQAAFEMIVARSHENVGVIRSAVNAQGMPLRGDTGQLQLDNREYFRGTEIEARTPAFAESTRPMADLMGPPNAHALAGHQHIDELAQAASHAQRPGSSGLNPRLQGVNLGLAAETAVTAYEWNETRQRAQVFANTLHNDSAARDAYVRQGAQTGGTLVGTAVGAGTAVAVGAGTGGAAVLVTGSAYLFGEAAEHGMELWQKRQIYNIQSEGVDWAFNGKQWLRKDLRADLIDDGQDVTRQQDFAAPPDKARELSAAASAKAVEQALGAVPQPRNPFVLPANDSDAHSLRARDWNYQPDTGQWLREVVTDLDHREMPSKFKTIEADDARAAQLSEQALQIIDGNLRASPAGIAAQYQIGHKAHGYDQTPSGTMPEAVTTALNPDLLQASDGRHYRRDAQGAWMHEGKTADPTRVLELELTRERLLPALQDHRQQLDRMAAWQAPTPEAQDKAMLREAYLNHGIDRETRQAYFDASHLAVQRTRAETGLTAATTSLVLGQDASGRFTPDSPIHHLRMEADGAVRIAAITTPEDIARALADVRARARGEETLQPASPPDIAPARTQAPDLRDPEHPGHDAFRGLRHKVSLYEARQGIPHGEHTDRVAAALLQTAAESGIPPYKAQLVKDPATGQTHLLDRRDPFQSEQQCPRVAVDVARLSSQPVETSSRHIDDIVSRREAPAQSQQRTPQPSQALAALDLDDQKLFARIRRDLPGHVSDAHAALAMQRAKQEGLRDADSLGTMMMIGSDLYLRGRGEAPKDLKVDTGVAAPPLQATVDAVNMANQQRTQAPPTQDEPAPRLARAG